MGGFLSSGMSRAARLLWPSLITFYGVWRKCEEECETKFSSRCQPIQGAWTPAGRRTQSVRRPQHSICCRLYAGCSTGHALGFTQAAAQHMTPALTVPRLMEMLPVCEEMRRVPVRVSVRGWA